MAGLTGHDLLHFDLLAPRKKGLCHIGDPWEKSPRTGRTYEIMRNSEANQQHFNLLAPLLLPLRVQRMGRFTRSWNGDGKSIMSSTNCPRVKELGAALDFGTRISLGMSSVFTVFLFLFQDWMLV
jgi:hypothetical protein